jgi:hypothetical protein
LSAPSAVVADELDVRAVRVVCDIVAALSRIERLLEEDDGEEEADGS